MVTAPSNFIRLRSLAFTAAIAGLARDCEVKDGHLIIPVEDIDEAMTIIGKLGELPERAYTPKDVTEKPDPLKALGETADKLRTVADAIDGKPAVSKPSPHVNGKANGAPQSKVIETKPGEVFNIDPSKGVNGVTRAEPVITEKPEPKLLDDAPMFATNAQGGSDEPPTGVRAKPATETKAKADKKPKAEKVSRNITDDVAAQGEPETSAPATTAAPEPEAPPAEESEDAPEETQDAAPPAASGAFDEEFISKAPKLRDIVVHLHERGLKTVDGILKELGQRKEHPLVSKAVVNADRVERMLDAVGITL